jgi:hypothetical protein
MPDEYDAEMEYNDPTTLPDNNGYTYENVHPDYAGEPDHMYNCTKCNKRLTNKDN